RPRPRPRRGDRSLPGDRRRLDDQRRPLQNRRHPRLADRQPVPRRPDRAPQSLALLLRGDPARDRDRLEPRRRLDRPPLRRRRWGTAMSPPGDYEFGGEPTSYDPTAPLVA